MGKGMRPTGEGAVQGVEESVLADSRVGWVQWQRRGAVGEMRFQGWVGAMGRRSLSRQTPGLGGCNGAIGPTARDNAYLQVQPKFSAQPLQQYFFPSLGLVNPFPAKAFQSF